MWYSPVSMTENERLSVCTTTNMPWPLLAELIPTKMTVCHLAILKEVNRLLWHGATGRRCKELVAQVRKILQDKIKPSRNCPFELLEWSIFLKIHSFHELNN